MHYYAITGRIIGDDEDEAFLVGPFPDVTAARQKFLDLMAEYRDREVDDLDIHSEEFGTGVYISSVLSSVTPIELE